MQPKSPPTRRFSLATLVSFSLHLRDSLREVANSRSTLALTSESSLRRVFNWDTCRARDVFNGELVEVLGASLTLLMSLWMSVSLVVTLANPSSSYDRTVSSAVEAECLTFFRASTWPVIDLTSECTDPIVRLWDFSFSWQWLHFASISSSWVFKFFCPSSSSCISWLSLAWFSRRVLSSERKFSGSFTCNAGVLLNGASPTLNGVSNRESSVGAWHTSVSCGLGVGGTDASAARAGAGTVGWVTTGVAWSATGCAWTSSWAAGETGWGHPAAGWLKPLLYLRSCFVCNRQMSLQRVPLCFSFQGELCHFLGNLVMQVRLRLALGQGSCAGCQDVHLRITDYYFLEGLATVALGYVGARLELTGKLSFAGPTLEWRGSLMMLCQHVVFYNLNFPHSLAGLTHVERWRLHVCPVNYFSGYGACQGGLQTNNTVIKGLYLDLCFWSDLVALGAHFNLAVPA